MDIFKLVGSVFVDTDKANDSLAKTDKKALGLGSTLLKGVKTAGKFAIGLGAACAAGATALVGVAKKAAATTDNIDKMSQKIGISREAYQELDFICSQTGSNVDSLRVGMKTLTNQMGACDKGTKSSAELFDKLGISIYDANGKMKSQEQMLFDTMGALQKVENQTEKAMIANKLFGKTGSELMPLFNGAAGSIEEMRQQAHDLGLVLNDESIDAGVKLTDTIDQVKRSFDTIMTKVGVVVMPIVQGVLDWVLTNMPLIQSVVGSVFKAIEGFVTSVCNVFIDVFSSISKALGDSGITFNDVMNGIQTVVGICFSAIKSVWETIGAPIFDYFKDAVSRLFGHVSQYFPQIKETIGKAFNEIKNLWTNHLKPCFDTIVSVIKNIVLPAFEFVFKTVIPPIISTFFGTFGKLWNSTLKPVLENVVDFVKNVFSGNLSGAFRNIIEVIKGIWKGLPTVLKAPLNAVIGILNSFINKINKLKIPSWVPGIGGKGISIPNIPLLAKGGTVIGAGKAIVGEAGAELVDLPAGARVSPLTNGNGDILGTDRMLEVLNAILGELKTLNEELYEKIVYSLINGVKIEWNNRELGRLVRKYA